MTDKETRNVVASVLARLRNNSRSSGAPFQQVLQLYAIERFLYRLSKSTHAHSVILKGALLLKTIGIPTARPTMDIDLLRKGNADQASLLALVQDCARLDVEADGLRFLADSAVAEEIATDSEYQGTRILMDARMDNVRLKLQIDFGVGDVMVPGPRTIDYPVVLDGESITLLAYPVESAVAGKLQAMVALGNANSRMKDFYDVWILSNHLDFNNDVLKRLNSPPGEISIHTAGANGVIEGRAANGPNAIGGPLRGAQAIPTLCVGDICSRHRLADQPVSPGLKATGRERGHLNVREFLGEGTDLAFIDLDRFGTATAGAPMFKIIRDALLYRVLRGIGIRPRRFDDREFHDVGPGKHTDAIGRRLIVGLTQLALVVFTAVEPAQIPRRRRHALAVTDRDPLGDVDVIRLMPRRQSLALIPRIQAYGFLQGCIPTI